jgi:hypothetical protein
MFISFSINAQKISILEESRKVIKTVDKKDLNKSIKEIGKKAQYLSKWNESLLKPEECRIKWEEINLISV